MTLRLTGLPALPTPEDIAALEPAEMPAFLGALLTLHTAAVGRLRAQQETSTRHDRMLGIKEAHKRIGVSKSYLYHNHRRLTFAKKIGRRLVFSEQGMERWLKTRPR